MRQVGNYPLWIGTARDARDIKGVLAAGIHAVVDLAAEELPVSPTRDLVYLRFPLVDGEGNELRLLRATLGSVVALLKARIPTLVACGMGMSRAPAVVAVAFATAYQLTPADVLNMMPGPGDVSLGLLRDLGAAVEEVS
ncbi:MAG: protein phosphatase [Gemmataceae bacterium]|nr:protein phosphatase [Gemmataceae bacterium]